MSNESLSNFINKTKNSRVLSCETEELEKSLSEQRLEEAKLRQFEIDIDDPESSIERYNGINAKIEGLSYYNPDEAVKQCMTKYESQGSEAIKSVKVKREDQGQFMCSEKDLADIKAQFPEGRRDIGHGPFHAIMIRKIRKWNGAICLFDVFESEMGIAGSKRKLYTVDNVKVLFYRKNSDGIASEIILKNKFMRFRHKAGKTKNL